MAFFLKIIYKGRKGRFSRRRHIMILVISILIKQNIMELV